MANTFFQFKQFTIHQDKAAMKVTTDACLFGAWVAIQVQNEKLPIKNVLDIGSGTGVLSLMFAQKNMNASIDAIEIDEDAFKQAKENIENSPFSTKINLMHGDVEVFDFTKKYDCIISNPPFYEREIKSQDKKRNIAYHSEKLILQKLLEIIAATLSVHGIFFLLLPFKRNDEIKKLFENFSLIKTTFVRQSIKHDYFRIMLAAQSKKNAELKTEIDEISICDEKGQYTKEFISLLKAYYLYL